MTFEWQVLEYLTCSKKRSLITKQSWIIQKMPLFWNLSCPIPSLLNPFLTVSHGHLSPIVNISFLFISNCLILLPLLFLTWMRVRGNHPHTTPHWCGIKLSFISNFIFLHQLLKKLKLGCPYRSPTILEFIIFFHSLYWRHTYTMHPKFHRFNLIIKKLEIS